MKQKIIILSLISVITSFSGSLFWTIFNLYLWDINFSLLQISILNAIPAIIYIFLSRFFGKLADLTRKKPFISAQLFLNFVAFMGFFYVIKNNMQEMTYFAILYAVLGLSGSIGSGALTAAVTTALRRGHTGEAMGTFLSFSAVGWTAGSFLSGFIADNFGIISIPLVSAVLLIIAETVFLFGYREDTMVHREVSLNRIFFDSWSFHLEGDTKSLILLFLIVVFFNFGGSIYMLAFTIKMYILFETKTMYGFIGGLAGVSNMVAPFFVGRVSDRVSKEKMLFFGLLIRNIFMLYLAVAWDKIATIIFMITPMWPFIIIPITSLATEYSSEGHESEVQSVRGIVGTISSTTGSIISGIIAQMINLRQNIFLMHIILLIGTLFYFLTFIPSLLLKNSVKSHHIYSNSPYEINVFGSRKQL